MVYTIGIDIYICHVYLCKLFFLAVDGGWWCPTFWFVKSLHNNLVYALGIIIWYIPQVQKLHISSISLQTHFDMGLIL